MVTGYPIPLAGADLVALPSGALFWPAQALLCVSDLHLGRSERMARRAGALLPPYDTGATLEKLDADLAATAAEQVICLGDSFDDLSAASSLDETSRLWLLRLLAGRQWIWIEGNHDPGPLDLGGTHRAEVRIGQLIFRHIAEPGAEAEVSGHFHPKARIAGLSRACFIHDARRLILPAYGAYTGGLDCADPAFSPLFGPSARVVLTGPRPIVAPLSQIRPRSASRSR